MDNAIIISKFTLPSQEILKNFLTTALKLDSYNLDKLLNVLISEQAGYPTPDYGDDEESSSNIVHCKNLFIELDDEEKLCLLQWFFNVINPLGLPITYGNEGEKLNQFVKFEIPRHSSYLGIKDSPTNTILEKLDKIAKCLNGYRNKIAELERAMDTAINNLDLIAESEHTIQSGSWSSGKAGCLSVLACRLAVESRNCLRRSYQERNRIYRPDEFDNRDVDDIPL